MNNELGIGDCHNHWFEFCLIKQNIEMLPVEFEMKIIGYPDVLWTNIIIGVLFFYNLFNTVTQGYMK